MQSGVSITTIDEIYLFDLCCDFSRPAARKIKSESDPVSQRQSRVSGTVSSGKLSLTSPT
jgi:hypothetical protein